MLGFTKQELSIVAFLIFSLLVGSFVKIYRYGSGTSELEATPQIDKLFAEKAKELDSLNAVGNTAGLVTATRPKKESGSASLTEKASVIGETSRPIIIKVNVNTASAEELQKIPKVGPVLAARILEYRNSNGKFLRVEDMTKVKGIGKKTLNQIKDFIILE